MFNICEVILKYVFSSYFVMFNIWEVILIVSSFCHFNGCEMLIKYVFHLICHVILIMECSTINCGCHVFIL